MKKISFLATAMLVSQLTHAAEVTLDVYKSPTCGCCTGWVKHIEDQGMVGVVHHPMNLTAVKDQFAIPANMRSCHTAVTKDGYIFEGHIPAKFIQAFLDQPPTKAKGLIVPAMPVGSPGMEYNNQFMAYKVLQLNRDGSVEVYAEVNTPNGQI
ncbi:DUF411 domain-containing protein [Maribrevibacterium harenarium]|uniref:DUF411 domain-containing protein n=1 Tax=Maribrevibacterium harenarium TaxID=2589817 RepID=A0A501WSB6_9GAMM|nr:DUF411 domain-containing protein [Maribrevibacterium harenarium]TPE51250.1 DUF411 domain-containing protein [Maribrevibacterium harenarium]